MSKKNEFEGYGSDSGIVENTGPATSEEMVEALEEFKQRALDNFGTIPDPAPVHPLFFRDGLIANGYTKAKANLMVLEKAKEQGFSREDYNKLKKSLEK